MAPCFGSYRTKQMLTIHFQSDTSIIQKLFSHFKRVASTHKLGVLYVIDSITRQWIEKARQSGQELAGIASPDGTYASGVYKMTELMPSLMDDIIRTAPQDQKVRLTECYYFYDHLYACKGQMLGFPMYAEIHHALNRYPR